MIKKMNDNCLIYHELFGNNNGSLATGYTSLPIFLSTHSTNYMPLLKDKGKNGLHLCYDLIYSH